MSTQQITLDAQNLTLIIGGNGKTGRRIAQRMIQRGESVRIGSRSGSPRFDWEDQSTWQSALEGVNKIYISYFPDLAVPSAPPAIEALCALAVEMKVRKLVLLSGRGEPAAQACEQIVQNCGINWTVLRASWFSQNFSEGFLRDAVLNGTVALPVGNVSEPFVDVEDIAEIACEALSTDKHQCRLYELTGPELLTFSQAVGQLEKYTGHKVKFQQISIEEFNTTMHALGVADEAVELLNYLFTTVLDGRNSHVTDGVQQALGRSAGKFQDYAHRAANEGAWKSKTADITDALH